MKIDFSQEIKKLDGTVLEDAEGILTLGVICCRALTGNTDKMIKPLHSYKLALSIYGKSIVDVKAKDITLMQERIISMFASPLVAGQASIMLEGGKDESTTEAKV